MNTKISIVQKNTKIHILEQNRRYRSELSFIIEFRAQDQKNFCVAETINCSIFDGYDLLAK